MNKSEIKKAAVNYIDNHAPFWMKAERQDRESSIEELTKFAESILRKASRFERTCYCGNPVDITNLDCDEFNLCKDHAQDS